MLKKFVLCMVVSIMIITGCVSVSFAREYVPTVNDFIPNKPIWTYVGDTPSWHIYFLTNPLTKKISDAGIDNKFVVLKLIVSKQYKDDGIVYKPNYSVFMVWHILRTEKGLVQVLNGHQVRDNKNKLLVNVNCDVKNWSEPMAVDSIMQNILDKHCKY